MENPKRTQAKIGDLLVVVVKKVDPLKKFTKGAVLRALIVRTKTSYRRSNGVWVKFNQNAVVLVNKKNAPLAKRIKGPMLKEICIKYNFLGTVTQFII